MIESWQELIDLRDREVVSTGLAERQDAWLQRCIARNRETRFGLAHGFRGISTVRDYRANVPLMSYEDLAPYIRSIERGEPDQLFAGRPIAFERTSGTTAGQKLIPFSPESLLDFQRAIVPWLAALAEREQITSGSAYWSISPATREPESTAGGIPIGLSDAAYLGEELTPLFVETSAVPLWVGQLIEVEDWLLATLYHLVRCRDLALISVWSPTFLTMLMSGLRTRVDEVATVLENGREFCGHTLVPDPEARDRLAQSASGTATQTLWPDLRLISCWTEGSSRPFAESLMDCFPGVTMQGKGLLMTEGVVTTPDNLDQSVLAADSGFFEFIDTADNLYLADELHAGSRYEVVMTTAGGLYRYRTSDWVNCEGYTGSGLPVLRFCGRQMSSDMVGEKLSEEFVTSCLAGITGFSMLLPVQRTLRPVQRTLRPVQRTLRPMQRKTARYLLVIDERPDAAELAGIVESRLAENPHYAYARKVGQLDELMPAALSNPLEIYLHSPQHGGTLLGDIKVPSLCLDPRVFGDHLLQGDVEVARGESA